MREEAISFSAFPAKAGPSLLSLFFALTTLAAGKLSVIASPTNAIVAALGGVAVIAIAGRVMLRWGTQLAVMEMSSTNLVCQRDPARAPGVWLVAHLDSKSQTIGMLARVASVVATVVLFVLFIITLLARIAGMPTAMGIPESLSAAQTSILAALTAVASLPLIFCFTTNRSRGALDNASGVAAVIIAAESLPSSANVGVLITTGEELALAGARAFALAHRERAIALNCDTLDDSGRFVCMVSGRPGKAALSIRSAASRLGETVTVRRMIMGILADNVAFSNAGWDSCTLSRGNLGTLARVHTSRDTPDHLDGTGIARAARILAATAEELS